MLLDIIIVLLYICVFNLFTTESPQGLHSLSTGIIYYSLCNIYFGNISPLFLYYLFSLEFYAGWVLKYYSLAWAFIIVV